MNATLRRPALGLALAAGLLLAFRPADEGLMQRIARQVSDYYATSRPEKAYLHLDKPVYATGETIWFSAYVVDAQRHQADSLSKVLYVELLSPRRQVVARRTLRLRGGLTQGDLDLSDTLRAGTYVLRAYTSWMRNAGGDFLYSRRLNVWPASTMPGAEEAAVAAGGRSKEKLKAAPAAGAGKPDLQFFPEGGSLVEGLPAVVGLKAVDANGRGIDVKGQILDGQNVVVASFSSRHLGMGRFTLTPAAGQRYHARLSLPDGSTADYPLPAVQAGGYTLHVADADDFFTVQARYHGTAGAPAPGPVMLLTEVRGFLVYPGQRALDAAGLATWRVPKDKYPSGIVHFTLFDAQGTPQAERLAFVQQGNAALQLSVTADKPSYGPHAPVQLTLKALDAGGQPVATRLSVAVTEAGILALDPDAETIASNLLLTSDLAGYVESPGYYFRPGVADAPEALDDLLLTQGWRRFVWKQVLAGQTPPPLFTPDQNLSLAGQVVSQFGSRPISNSQLTFIQTKPIKQVVTATSNAEGRFRFTGFDGKDTAVVTLQARRAQGGSNVLIRPDNGPPSLGPNLPDLPPVLAASPAVVDYVRRSRQQQVAERNLHPDDPIRTVVLGNVSVTAKRPLVPEDDPRRFPGATPSSVLDLANMPAASSGLSIFQLLQGRVAGLVVSGTPPELTVQIRGQGTPLFILDGQQVDIDFVSTLVASDIETVEVYKGGDASIFGGNGGGGVLAIYTKRGDPNYRGRDLPPTPGILTVRVPSYYRAREFYSPRYNAALTNQPADPRRTTLYWNPAVQTDASGQAKLSFFTADGSGSFQAVAEGLTSAGQPARGTGTVVVRGK